MTAPEPSSSQPDSLEDCRDLLGAGAVAIATGAQAARLLGNASQATSDQDPLRLEVVRELASDIERQLEALAGSIGEEDPSVDLLVEATLRCADLANLAACNVRELRPGAGATVVYLASGAARALGVLVEAGSRDLGKEHAENTLRDVRGASWRVDLAVRQLDEQPD